MPKPIYSRIFADDEDNLPASQIIDEVYAFKLSVTAHKSKKRIKSFLTFSIGRYVCSGKL